MIIFHAEANTFEELKAQMREALGETSPCFTVRMPEPCDPVQPDPQPEEAKPAQKPEEAKPNEQPNVATYTLVEVRAAANAYRDKHGIEKLREIFKKHGGEKLKDIPESNYVTLMQEIG